MVHSLWLARGERGKPSYRFANLAVGVACILIFYGCGDGPVTGLTAPGARIHGDNLYYSSIKLFVVEGSAPQPRSLSLRAETDRYFPTGGFGIEFEHSQINMTIVLRFGDVLPPYGLVVTEHPDPARARIPLGALPEGKYLLDLVIRGNNQAATMNVTRDSIVVADGNGRWTEFPRPVLHRSN